MNRSVHNFLLIRFYLITRIRRKVLTGSK